MPLFQKNKFNLTREFREEPFIVFVQRNVPGTFGEVGFCWLTFLVMLDFLRARIIMNCEKIS